jgi:hypothetical protein
MATKEARREHRKKFNEADQKRRRLRGERQNHSADHRAQRMVWIPFAIC